MTEAERVKEFLNSPVWAWVKERCQAIVRRSLMTAAKTGTSDSDRLLLLGKAAFAAEILERPGQLALAARVDQEEQARLQLEDQQRPPRQFQPHPIP